MRQLTNLLSVYLTIFFLIIVFILTTNAQNSVSQKENEAKQLSLIWDGSSISRSIILFSEAASEYEKLGEMQKASDNLRKATNLLIVSSEYETALKQLQKAIKIDEKIHYTDGKIISLSILSRLKNQSGKIGESEKYYKQALYLSNSSNSSSAKANALFSAAEFTLFFGDIKETINLYERAFLNAKEANDKQLMSEILVNLGFSYLREGNLSLGLQKEQDSLAIAEEIENRRSQALALNGIASLYVFMDEKRKSLDIFLKAESMYPNNFDWLEKGKLFNGIATIYEDYQEFRLAEKYRQNAFDCFGKAKYPYGQLATLPSLARYEYRKKDYAAGKKLYDESLVLAKKLHSDFHIAVIKEDLGILAFEEGSFDSAINNYKSALQIYDRLKIRLPRIQNRLGESYAKKGKLDLAKNYFNSALIFNRRNKDSLSESENLYNLSKITIDEDNFEKSLNTLEESLKITDSLSKNVFNKNLSSSFFSNVYEHYELYINLLMKINKQSRNENYAIEALQASEKSRARSMLETLQLSEANFTKDADPELVEREKEITNSLNLKADKLTELLSSNAEKAETDKLDDEINSLQNELEDIKGKLKANSPLYSAIKNPVPFDVGDFQANVLDDKTLLLEFSFGADESYVWLIGKNEVKNFTLPKREILDLRIQKLLDLLKSREISEGEEPENYQKRISEAEVEYRTEARVLSGELFGQFADKLGGKRLIIVPDGKLSYFPISALPLPNIDNDQPILLTNEVVYESSAATLQILGKTPHPEKAEAKELLVFADPIFSLQDNRLAATDKISTDANDTTALLENNLRSFQITDSNGQFPRLFATQEEAESIAEIVGASQTNIASGFSANRSRFMAKDVADYRIIHFATHGLMDDTRPELSGIVLSMFDEKGEPQQGFVRLQDIYSQNLSADLIVLSACQSGIGKEIKGEGLMSLTNGFIQSGAKSVLSSLWKVDDYATAELMKNFYRELSAKNLTPSQALRNAQIKMRENPQFQSPFYWAAFNVNGEFRQPISFRSNQFSYLWIVLSVLIIISAWFIFKLAKAR